MEENDEKKKKNEKKRLDKEALCERLKIAILAGWAAQAGQGRASKLKNRHFLVGSTHLC